MLYQRPKFTCPASQNTSQIQWDFAFLTKADFIMTWGEALYAYYTEDSKGRTKSDSKNAHKTTV